MIIDDKNHNPNTNSKLRFALITGHQNRSGYTTLKKCIEREILPSLVIVTSDKPALSNSLLRKYELIKYSFKCWFYRCDSLRMLESEVLLAHKHKIPLLRIDSLKTEEAKLKINEYNLDLIVVAGGWKERIPIEVIKVPKHGTINIHPSLLPEFRGTSVTRWQILNGANRTGVTIHYMNEEFDTGKPIAQKSITLDDIACTPQELFQKLSNIGSELLLDLLDKLNKGMNIKSDLVDPDKRFVRYFSKWKWDKDRLAIDLTDDLINIHYQILASSQESYEYPGPILRLNNKDFIIRKTNIIKVNKHLQKSIDQISNNYLFMEDEGIIWIRPNDTDALLITKIQPAEKYKIRRANSPKQWFEKGETIILSDSN